MHTKICQLWASKVSQAALPFVDCPSEHTILTWSLCHRGSHHPQEAATPAADHGPTATAAPIPRTASCTGSLDSKEAEGEEPRDALGEGINGAEGEGEGGEDAWEIVQDGRCVSHLLNGRSWMSFSP